MGIGHRICASPSFRGPLMRSSRTFHQLPLIAKQVFEIVVIPSHRVGRPSPFDAAGDRIPTFASAEAALPAQTLILNAGPFGFAANQCRIARTVAFAKGMSTRHEGNSLLVVHRHPPEGFANISA